MHTIHDITFEVDVNYSNSGVSWEQYYIDFFQERLLPHIERLCNDWDKKHPNSKCIIDAIDVNVDTQQQDLETLQKEITQQIHQQLRSIQSNGTSTDANIVATIIKEASPFEALLVYLSDGILPANISVKAFKEWLGAVAEFTHEEKNELTTLFSTKSEAIERMLSLLRNEYEKLSTIITTQQQITAHYVKLEKAFFQEFLKELCTQFKLQYNNEEAAIWYQTLGVSNSLPQFSKTLLLLLTSKAAKEHKRLRKSNEAQLTIAVLQAITQKEKGNRISIDVSNIATIQKIDTQSSSATATKESAQQSSSKQKTSDKNQTENTKENKRSQKEEITSETSSKTAEQKQKSVKNQSQDNDVHAEAKQQNHKTKANDEKASAESSTALAEHLAKANAAIEADEKIKKKFSTIRETPTIYKNTIENEINLTTEKAGLILLHPFLSRFFGGLGVLTENNEINDVGKACMLLHYLATETEDVTDVELTLEKTLLGIPLETVINYQTPLTSKDKEGCEELLKAVLEHWVVLKKSTINTLRDMFLKRDGALTKTENSIKLKIERAAQDVLLDKVPWNISLIRLKWMEQMMHVEW
ncbi:hypothetical protein C8N46_102538 [Kordia periserrulae]|uniref:Uncharacterized protein n=1 Tax=Kordia periserrulae TaxID=701523 RepID=A0A2T6C4B6_9FLAO|nr:contractile injection system tape measure protein [Kordia periserrulae]PTX63135.1 hypothetical protein C8N46_102538 [Kordia periserrulae]